MRALMISEIETVAGGLVYEMQPCDQSGPRTHATSAAEMVLGICRHFGLTVTLGDCKALVEDEEKS